MAGRIDYDESDGAVLRREDRAIAARTTRAKGKTLRLVERKPPGLSLETQVRFVTAGGVDRRSPSPVSTNVMAAESRQVVFAKGVEDEGPEGRAATGS